MNDTIKNILTAPEIIAINQDPLGIQGTRIRNNSGLQVWQKPLEDGSIAVALLNLTTSSVNMYVSLDEIGFEKGVSSNVRDLWNRKDIVAVKDSFQTFVEPHGVVVVKIKGKKAPVSELKFNQTSIELNLGNHKLVQLSVIPSITPVTITSSNEEILTLSIAGVNTYRLSAMKVGKCTLKASTKDGSLITSCDVHVVPSNIPVPWKMNDIKDNKASATYVNGIFTIEGGGNDIWGASDQFAFLNRKVSQNTFISARIISQANTDPWAKSGMMFRESLAPNSVFAMLCITPGNGVSLQWRDTTGGICNKKDFSSTVLPVYFKLSKNGSIFRAYKSTDGKQWDLLGDITLNRSFAEPYFVGMEVLSHSTHMMNLSEFDHVKVEPRV